MGLTNKEKFEKDSKQDEDAPKTKKKDGKDKKEEDEDSKEFFLGQEAIRRQYMCTLKWPCNDYKLNDFATYEKMLETVFEEKLFLKTDGITVVTTDPMLSTQKEREKLCEVMFEK